MSTRCAFVEALRNGYNVSEFLVAPTDSSVAFSNANSAPALMENGTTLQRTAAELVIGTIFLLIVETMAVVGNTMVIAVIFTHRPLNKVQNYLLVSLSTSDLCVAVFVVPFHVANFVLGKWPLGAILCQLWITFDIWLCTASILNLCAIAQDRFWAIHDPINYANRRTLRFVLAIIALVWLISGLISIPPLLGWNDWSKTGSKESCEYTQEQGFVVYSACGSFYIPLMIMCTTYVKIFITARKRLRRRTRGKSLKASWNLHKATATAKISVEPVPAAQNEEQPGNSGTTNNSGETSNPEKTQDPTVTIVQQAAAVRSKVTFGELEEVQIENGDLTSTTPPPSSKSPLLRARNSLRKHVMNRSSRRKHHKEMRLEEQQPLPTTPEAFFKEKERISISKEKKAAKTLAIVVGIFVLCWLPFFLLYIIQPFCDGCIHPKIFEATNWLGYINSGLNPIIYTVFNTDFREGFARLIRRHPFCRNRI